MKTHYPEEKHALQLDQMTRAPTPQPQAELNLGHFEWASKGLGSELFGD